jgi:hypothetical protein
MVSEGITSRLAIWRPQAPAGRKPRIAPVRPSGPPHSSTFWRRRFSVTPVMRALAFAVLTTGVPVNASLVPAGDRVVVHAAAPRAGAPRLCFRQRGCRDAAGPLKPGTVLRHAHRDVGGRLAVRLPREGRRCPVPRRPSAARSRSGARASPFASRGCTEPLASLIEIAQTSSTAGRGCPPA